MPRRSSTGGLRVRPPPSRPGNVEQFIGVAQVPIGLAGPLIVNGEHAKGEFLIPLATTEGTLVASYNRGMKVLHAPGGVDDGRSTTACSARPVHLRQRPRGARVPRVGGRALRRDQGRRRGDDQLGPAASRSSTTRRAAFSSRASTSPPATPPGRTSRQGDAAACRWILEQLPRDPPSSSSPTSRRTRRARRSTSCARAASASSRRPRSRRAPASGMGSSSELLFRARVVANVGSFSPA